MRDITSLISDEIIHKQSEMVDMRRLKADSRKISEQDESESKHDFNEDQVEQYEPLKIKVDSNKKAKGKF